MADTAETAHGAVAARCVRRWSRWGAALTAVLLVVAGEVGVAAGEEPPQVTPGGPSTIDVGGRDGGGGGEPGGERSGGPRPGAGPRAPRPPRPVLEPRLVLRDGERCVVVGRVEGDPASARALEAEARLQRLVRRYGLCPRPDGSGDALVPPQAAALQALRERVELPAPGVAIRPGRAITGLPAFLEIEGERDGAWRFTVFDWVVDIDVTSSYDVDWGDGTVVTGLTSRGGPHPDGDVHHTYRHAGDYDVVVTQRWTAAWTATGPHGSAHGVIEDQLATRAVVDDLPVGEVQAVRTR